MRLSSIRIITGVSCLFVAAAAWQIASRSSSDFTAEAQTVKPSAATAAQLHPVSASIPITTKPVPIAAPGTELYTAKRGEAIPTIARRYLGRTSYLTSSQLADAIRQSNGDRTANILKANENIIIPGILSAPVTEKTIPVAKDFEVRAIYLTGIMAGQRPRTPHHPPLARSRRQRRGLRHQRLRRQRQHSLRAPAARPAPGLHSRRPETSPLPAPAKHARHRAHRHLPRRAPGQGAPRTSRPIPHATTKPGAKTANWSGPIPASPKSRTTTSPWPNT